MQPDSIIPDPSNPQSWNRYSYVQNNPINFNDPTGHNGECAADETCSQLLEIFVEAALDTESPYGVSTRWRFNFNIFGVTIKNGYYSGIGLAKVSDAEMEGEYGEVVDTKHIKVGLGLRNKPCDQACIAAMDQADPNIAATAMKTRLTIRLDICVKHGCTKTDMLILSAIAGDERITPDSLNSAFKNYKSDNKLVTINWDAWIKGEWSTRKNQKKNRDLIKLFSENVKESHSEEFSEDEWEYIGGLAQ